MIRQFTQCQILPSQTRCPLPAFFGDKKDVAADLSKHRLGHVHQPRHGHAVIESLRPVFQ